MFRYRQLLSISGQPIFFKFYYLSALIKGRLKTVHVKYWTVAYRNRYAEWNCERESDLQLISVRTISKTQVAPFSARARLGIN